MANKIVEICLSLHLKICSSLNMLLKIKIMAL